MFVFRERHHAVHGTNFADPRKGRYASARKSYAFLAARRTGTLIQPACEELLVRGFFYGVWATRVGSGTGVLPDSAGDPARALRGRICTSMWLSLARICARRRSGHQS